MKIALLILSLAMAVMAKPADLGLNLYNLYDKT